MGYSVKVFMVPKEESPELNTRGAPPLKGGLLFNQAHRDPKLFILASKKLCSLVIQKAKADPPEHSIPVDMSLGGQILFQAGWIFRSASALRSYEAFLPTWEWSFQEDQMLARLNGDSISQGERAPLIASKIQHLLCFPS